MFSYIFPAVGQIRDFHPLECVHASLFDTLVGTFVETSEGGYSVWLKNPG